MNKVIDVFFVGIRERGLSKKGSFQNGPFSRDSGDLRDSREV